jgi:PAP2 superfamily
MNRFAFTLSLIVTLLFFSGCGPGPDPVPTPRINSSIPTKWADVTLDVIKNSTPNSPTYASRSLGYIGLTMYESIVHGSVTQRSMVGQLNGLQSLPQPTQAEYNWPIALNAGQAYILKKLYPHTSITNVIDAMEQDTYNNELTQTSSDVAARSVAYGQAIAEAIYQWSITDGGNEGYKKGFDPNFTFPIGNGYWTPPFAGQSASRLPLHPYWGSNRAFVSTNAKLPMPDFVSYSQSSSSSYYAYFLEVHKKQKGGLTDEEKRIAAWWADDPSQTASPPGHSYNLASIIIASEDADLFTAAEVYAKVGMAVADAFINCWKCKYHYFAERPYPYIRAYIDNSYQPFWPEPPFPAFYSGHATQSAATAKVLQSLFDNNTTVVDDTYALRKPDFQNIPYSTRTFNTIWATAQECAYSRFLGGIHTRLDNEVGTSQGMVVGQNVVALNWKK